jgi:hypothetical protein
LDLMTLEHWFANNSCGQEQGRRPITARPQHGPPGLVRSLRSEARQLRAIFAASRRTALAKLKRRAKQS